MEKIPICCPSSLGTPTLPLICGPFRRRGLSSGARASSDAYSFAWQRKPPRHVLDERGGGHLVAEVQVGVLVEHVDHPAVGVLIQPVQGIEGNLSGKGTINNRHKECTLAAMMQNQSSREA